MALSALRATVRRLPRHLPSGRDRHLATATAWHVRPDTPDYADRAAQSILTNGFVVLEGLLSPEALKALQAPLLERTDRVFDDLDSKGVALDVGSAKGFHEVVLRSPGRWDLPCEAAIVPSVVRDACERGPRVGPEARPAAETAVTCAR